MSGVPSREITGQRNFAPNLLGEVNTVLLVMRPEKPRVPIDYRGMLFGSSAKVARRDVIWIEVELNGRYEGESVSC